MRPIDADAITYCSYDLDAYHWFRAVDEDEIAEMPTLTLDDMRPKGQWLDKCVRDWHCSECGEKLRGHGFDGYVYKDLPNFCQNCGADMRGGGEE